MSGKRELVRRDDLVLRHDGQDRVQINTEVTGDLVVIDADELRWLITTAGPAALHAIGAAPQIRKGGPDAEGT